MKRLFKKIKCALGFHDNYKWKPYPVLYSECEVNRCKVCDHYEWR